MGEKKEVVVEKEKKVEEKKEVVVVAEKEKKGEEKKEVVVEKEKKVEEITAVYKLNIHCKECARVIEEHFLQHQGVHKVDVDAAGGKVTVKGVEIDVVKIREVVEKKCRKKVELISPIPKKVEKVVERKEEKKKEVVVKIIEVKVFMHCGRCETYLKEVLLIHKEIYTVKTNRSNHTCTITGTIEDKKLIEYIQEKTRKRGEIIMSKKEEKVKVVREEEKVKVVKEEEKVKVEAKDGKKGAEVKIEVTEKKEKEEIKSKEIVVPYLIPCTHPQFAPFSHPEFMNCSPCFQYHPGCIDYSDPDFKNYRDTAFVHCPHPPLYLSEENPHACSVM